MRVDGQWIYRHPTWFHLIPVIYTLESKPFSTPLRVDEAIQRPHEIIGKRKHQIDDKDPPLAALSRRQYVSKQFNSRPVRRGPQSRQSYRCFDVWLFYSDLNKEGSNENRCKHTTLLRGSSRFEETIFYLRLNCSSKCHSRFLTTWQIYSLFIISSVRKCVFLPSANFGGIAVLQFRPRGALIKWMTKNMLALIASIKASARNKFLSYLVPLRSRFF